MKKEAGEKRNNLIALQKQWVVPRKKRTVRVDSEEGKQKKKKLKKPLRKEKLRLNLIARMDIFPHLQSSGKWWKRTFY